jgi:methyltransferase
LRVAGEGGVTPAVAVLGIVTMQRLAELLWARYNASRLLVAGAVEYGRDHYPYLVALHVAWLGGLWFLAWDRSLNWLWIAVYAGLQVLRGWVLFALGPRWTTRIIVLPGVALVRTGPYRYLSHPNYAVVAAEVAVLPLAFDLMAYAIIFSVLNAVVLAVRIRTENAALETVADTGGRRRPVRD